MGGIAEATERRAQTFSALHPRDPALVAYFGGSAGNAAGEAVTPETASRERTVIACERYISETLAGLPLPLMRRVQPRGREQATDHWLYERLHDQSNLYQTAFQFRRLEWNWYLFRGNWAAQIVPSRRMPPFEFLPLHPDRLRYIEEDDGTRFYEFTGKSGRVFKLRYGEVWHFGFLPLDGWRGRSILDVGLEVIGQALATAKYGARVFKNNANPSGVLKSKKTLSREAKIRIGRQWQEDHSGDSVGRVAVLDEELDFSPVTMTNQQAQMLEMSGLSALGVTQIFNVKPPKVNLLDRATWNNIEQLNIDSVTDTLMPHAINFEQSARKDLLVPAERKLYYVKHNFEGLLRGDFKTRQEGLAIQRQNGIIDGNDWAEVEDRNPFEGGDKRFVPLNWVDLNVREAVTEAAPAPAPQDQQAERSFELMRRLRNAHAGLFEDAARRVLRREADEIGREFRRQAQSRSVEDFDAWVQEYFAQSRETVERSFAGAVRAFGGTVADNAAASLGLEAPDVEVFLEAYVRALASRHSTASVDAVRVAMAAGPAVFEEMLIRWRDSRPLETARDEVNQLANAAARQVWMDAGVKQLRWVVSAACASCCQGDVRNINETFSGKAHPPMHPGCDCIVVAA